MIIVLALIAALMLYANFKHAKTVTTSTVPTTVTTTQQYTTTINQTTKLIIVTYNQTVPQNPDYYQVYI